MGTRMEIYCEGKDCTGIISLAEKYGVAARVVGRVEAAQQELLIQTPTGQLIF